MKPILWSFELPGIGPVGLPAYISLLTLGFALAILLAWREAPRVGIDRDKLLDLSLYIIIFSVLGSRIFHVLFDGHLVDYINACVAPHTIPAVGGDVPASCTSDAQCGAHALCNTAANFCYRARDCLLALKVWRGGLTYYGGFIAACLTTIVFCRVNRLPLWRIADLYGYGTALGLFWGRMGCYYNGCCFGKVCHTDLGLAFPRGSIPFRHQLELGQLSAAAPASLPVYPTQLYAAGLNLAVFFVVYFWVRPRKRFDGQVFWTFIVLKALTRAVVEVFRDDDRGVYFGFLSTSQIVSLGFFVLAVFVMRRLAAGARKAQQAELGG